MPPLQHAASQGREDCADTGGLSEASAAACCTRILAVAASVEVRTGQSAGVMKPGDPIAESSTQAVHSGRIGSTFRPFAGNAKAPWRECYQLANSCVARRGCNRANSVNHPTSATRPLGTRAFPIAMTAHPHQWTERRPPHACMCFGPSQYANRNGLVAQQ